MVKLTIWRTLVPIPGAANIRFVLENGTEMLSAGSSMLLTSNYDEAYTCAQLVTLGLRCGLNQLLVIGTDTGILIGLGLCEAGLRSTEPGSQVLQL